MAKTTSPAPPAGPQKPYVVLARKYRPQTFADLIGQEAMVRTLRNAFATGRIAQGYMLTGVRGVGKTTTARILARALNYALPSRPAAEATREESDETDAPTIDMPKLGVHCQEIMESRHPDVIEMDAASNTGIENVREIIEGARYRPISARMKVFIIDEVHMLSKGAFNALLKTLEEPPEHVKFIFATTEIRRVPVTVLSRCQRFDLRRVDVPTLTAHFKGIAEKEGIGIEDDALMQIARAAEGSVRDGLSMLDQAFATATGTVAAADVRAMLGLSDRSRIFPLLESVLRGDAKAALTAFGGLHHDGADPVQVLSDLAETVHVATRIRVGGREAATDTLPAQDIAAAESLAQRLQLSSLSRAWQMLLKGIEEVGRAPDQAAAADMVLIRMAHMATLPAPEDLVRGIGSMPAGGSAAPSGVAPPAPKGPKMLHVVGSNAAVQAPAPVQVALAVVPALPATFADLVAFVGAQRDMNLRLELEEHVRLVRYDAPNLEVNLAEGAASGLIGDLQAKLQKWTGQRWIVIVSREAGAPPLAEVARAAQAAERDKVMADPMLQRVLRTFPGIEIVEVRPMSGDKDRDKIG